MRTLQYIILTVLFTGTLSAQVNTLEDFFFQTNTVLAKYVQAGKVDYASLIKDETFDNLIGFVGTADVSAEDENTIKAFRINAYNLQVMNQVKAIFPVNSVQAKAGFFDRVKMQIEGESTTLNVYEKKKMLRAFEDPRFHFVLVCGAIGCPPIVNKAYLPDGLETMMERQTMIALNNPEFIRVEGEKAKISQIFKWYTSDFGGSESKVLQYINDYRTNKISKISGYYDYDWNLNSLAGTVVVPGNKDKSANRYVVSAAIPQGSVELKLFNNLYSQTTGNRDNSGGRSTFYTAAISALYGVTGRFNAGIAARYRFVRNDGLPSSPLATFTFEDSPQNRTGLTALGPQIRWAPFPALKNFSIQSSYTFPIGENLEGVRNSETGATIKPYIDWDGGVFNTQFFNDFTLSNSFSLFTEIDVLIQDIGFDADKDFWNSLSTPLTVIGSYFPNAKTTIYALTSFSPTWTGNFDYFYQAGAGLKYQVSPSFEIELLGSYFQTKFLLENDGSAATYNIGLRYSL